MASKVGEMDVIVGIKEGNGIGGLIAGLARQAAAVSLVTLPGDGRTVGVFNHATAELTYRPIEPAPRDHRVFSVESFTDIAARVVGSMRGLIVGPVAWHGHDAVVLVCDDADRRDRVTLALPPSEPFTWLGQLAKSPSMNQTTLIRVLRLKLGQPAELVSRFRKLDFSAGKTGASRVEHGKESLGREIQAVVQGIDELPDVLDVSVRITDVPGANKPETIRVGLEIDPQREEFFLAPMPGELEAAVDRMHADLHARLGNVLGEVGIPVYYGAP